MGLNVLRAIDNANSSDLHRGRSIDFAVDWHKEILIDEICTYAINKIRRIRSDRF